MSESNADSRIAVLLPELFGAGGQRSMLNLVHGLADLGYTVDLVVGNASGEFADEVNPTVRLVDLGKSRIATAMPAVWRYLRRERPDAMLSCFAFVNLIAIVAWKLARVPTRLFVVEQNTVSLESANAPSFRGRHLPKLTRRLYPWATGIVVVSEGVREDLARVTKIPIEKIEVAFNPSVAPEEAKQKAQARVDQPWFEPGEPPVLLAVGRLNVQKDYGTLISAFAQVRRNRPVRLIVLGEGREREAMEAMISELGLEDDVSLPGFVDNPFGYMARCSLFVLSSRWEGLPTVLIEALCCGARVVSTDCPSGPREILRGGEFGTLVPVGDSEALAAAIEAGFDSDEPPPPEESWRRYDTDTRVEDYARMLLGRR